MKTLTLLRHAKSSWEDPNTPDFERPLSERGRVAAPIMGSFLKKIGFHPDLILCSPSKRTRQTVEMVDLEIGKGKISYDEDIYLASEETLFGKILKLPSHIQSVIIIGHNPGLHNLALLLIGGGKEETIKKLKLHYPTGAIAILTFQELNWYNIKPGTGNLSHFVTPKSMC